MMSNIFPPTRFANTHQRIDRAISIWEEFTRCYNRYVAGVPFEALVDNAENEGLGIYRVTRLLPIPKEMPAIIGDLIHNLRVSLDYLAVELAKENGTTDTKSLKSTYFPLSLDKRSFQQDGRKKIKFCSAQAQQIIEELQPYQINMGNLYDIHALDLVDKHNSIIPVAAASINFSPQFNIAMEPDKIYNGSFEVGGTYEASPPKFPLNIGDEVGRIYNKTAESTSASGRVDFHIVFYDVGVAEGLNVAELLHHFICMVNFVVQTIETKVPPS